MEFVDIRGVAPYLSDHNTRGWEVDFLAFDPLVVGVREAFTWPLGIRQHRRIQRIGKRALSFSPQASTDGGMMRAVAERMTKVGLDAARHPFMPGPIMSAGENSARYRVNLADAKVPMPVESTVRRPGLGVFDDDGGLGVKTEFLGKQRDHAQRLFLGCLDGGRQNPMAHGEPRIKRPGVAREVVNVGLGPTNDLDGLIVLAPEKVLAEPRDARRGHADSFDDHVAAPKCFCAIWRNTSAAFMTRARPSGFDMVPSLSSASSALAA